MGPGHNTHHWTAERVQFMADAAEYGSFPGIFAAAIAAEVPVHGHICDAGCGTGWLAAALARRFVAVTAVDTSAEALAVLRKDGRTPENLQIVQDDIFTYQPERKFDAMVFCFFGSIAQTLQAARRLCRGTVVLIKRSHPERQFAAGSPHRNTMSYAEEDLAARGIPYRARTLRVEMGQPLRTEADAVRFVRAYSDAPEQVDPEEVFRRLEPIRCHPEFHFYLPREREIGLFSFEIDNQQEDLI